MTDLSQEYLGFINSGYGILYSHYDVYLNLFADLLIMSLGGLVATIALKEVQVRHLGRIKWILVFTALFSFGSIIGLSFGRGKILNSYMESFGTAIQMRVDSYEREEVGLLEDKYQMCIERE